MNCNSCGEEVTSGSTYCEQCGEKLQVNNFQIDNVSKQNGMDVSNKSFSLYLAYRTWWWVPISLTSFLLFMRESNQTVYIMLSIWIAYKVWAWKSWASSQKNQATLSNNTSKPPDLGRLFIAIIFSIIIAYFVSDAADTRAFYHDLPYQAAIESGYSPDEAEKMIPQLVQLVNLPQGIFLTSTGWLWFLILSGVYTWRCYVLLINIKYKISK